MFGDRARRAPFALVAALLIGGTARADDPESADALFREGRELLKGHDLEHACPKLEASFRLDPSAGTLLNLARCHEEQGKTATAWGEYAAAERLARQQGRKNVASVAHDRGGDLGKRLLYATIRVKAWVPGLEVREDDRPIAATLIGTPLPVDPGPHTLDARAPGFESWSSAFQASTEGTSVEVPELAKLAEPPTSAESPAAEPDSSPVRIVEPAIVATHWPRHADATRPLGYGSISVGAAGLIAGAIFGGLALHEYSEAEGLCPSRQGCGTTALSDRDRAGTSAWIADVSIGVGIVGVALGAYLLLRAPHSQSAPVVGSSRDGLRITF